MRKLVNEELGRISVDEYKQVRKAPILVILDNVRSLNNIGSVFRTADAFCIEEIYLCGITATPPNKDIHKTALGATESVKWQYFEDTMVAVKKAIDHGYTIISVEQVENSLSLDAFMPDRLRKYAVIFGHEIKGVSQMVVDASHLCIEIPQFGTKHSLNISVSAGIVLWDFYRKLNLE